VRETQLAQQQQAQTQRAVAEYNRANDKAFQKQFAKEYPNQNVRELSKYVMQALRKSGVDEGRITQLWHSGALRGVETQMLLARAGMFERAEERARNLNSKRVPVPPVQRPGTYRPAGSGDIERVRDLQGALERATGHKAVKLAAELTRP
jgi:hypothetical protein